MAKTLEIEFKGGRKDLFANPQEFPFVVGDLVIVEAEKGEDLGRVVNMGSLVDQRAEKQELKKIKRKPNRDNLAQMAENERLEKEAFKDCRKRIEEHGLVMKLVDVEYQFDRNKITFYFTADVRVDFRALVRDLASRYKTRIELRQIGVRDEAKRIGGVGVCGRRLCCTTFLREFEPVVTQFAKDQNLALNPTKLSGCCGRLMCCLKYERDFYAKTRELFPPEGTIVKTERGTGRLKSVDVLKESCLIQYENGEEEFVTLEIMNQLLNTEQEKKQQRKKKRRKRGKKRRKPNSDRKKENTGN